MATGKDDSKKEFLSDAGSFVNAGGGNLIFGITEVGRYSQGARCLRFARARKGGTHERVRPA